MVLIEGEPKPKREEVASETVLFVEEGGRQPEAKVGLMQLAKEITLWQKHRQIRALDIFLPSGTGTTALFLQHSLGELENPSRVYTTPCVGDGLYLKSQFRLLEEREMYHPTILEPKKKYHFGKLYRESYDIWLKLREEMGIEFDLLYDPVGWMTMMQHRAIFSKPLLYIHQGGLIGNESMLARYQRRYSEDIKQ